MRVRGVVPVGLLAFGAVVSSTCLEPTQVELWLSTDVPCAQVHGTTITVGSPTLLETKPPSEYSSRCDPSTGYLGSLMVVPSGDEDGGFAVKVVTAVSAGAPAECVAPDYRGCIVARRSLRYVSGRTLYLPIAMAGACEDQPCPPDKTCDPAGLCRSATIEDPSRCVVRSACGVDALTPPDGAGGRSGGGGASGTGAGGGPSVSSLLSAGSDVSCVWVSAGAQCWGGNEFGQVGTHLTDPASLPSPATVKGYSDAPMADIRQIEPGSTHTCAVLNSGSVVCWGQNNVGQLGRDNPRDLDVTPAPVFKSQNEGGTPLGEVAEVALGFQFSCVRQQSGKVYCWGRNNAGQLGRNSFDQVAVGEPPVRRPTPLPVIDPSGMPIFASRIALGGSHACAVDENQKVLCWGANSQGELATGEFSDAEVPRAVAVPALLKKDPPSDLEGVSQIALGDGYSCALVEATRKVLCWGLGDLGQLGRRLLPPDDHAANLPDYVVDKDGLPITGVTALSSTDAHTCALQGDRVLCWGKNKYAQLGRPTGLVSPDDPNGFLNPSFFAGPAVLADGTPLQGASSIIAGDSHACAQTASGLLCWGRNNAGQLGRGESNNPVFDVKPALVPGITLAP